MTYCYLAIIALAALAVYGETHSRLLAGATFCVGLAALL